MSSIALVTGGNRGIGLAIAHSLAEAGHRVVVTYRTGAAPSEFLAVKMDVTSTESVEAAFAEIESKWGTPEIIVANAGITKDARLVNMTEEQFDAVIDVNLKGVFNCTQAVVPYMLQAGCGSIVSASSVVGLYGNFGQTNYAATKYGVIGFTTTWARELGPKGIRVNAVCPGFVETNILASMP